jgi:hypothetical protein
MSTLKLSYKFIFEILAAFSIVFSITWSVLSQKKQYEWERKLETLHFLESRDRGHLRSINKKIKNIENQDSLLNVILSDSTLLSEIKVQLIQYEDISIGSNIGVYDNDVIKRFIGNSFINFNKKMQPYILYVRKRDNNPNLYLEYDNCVKALPQE